ncbi:MarR family transcriptional regulator [Cryptosporangium arvum]|uniref:MarR family transcriptional regulator n=1 Tax=Cryptosporangium arvum TaxID=80871 RepID=UPI0004BC976B
MPTGRLTPADRRYIAARLAEGTAYAEIARHLAKPTSTISREVNRNGGPRRYRPEQAQQATTIRARRRRGSRPAVPPPETGATHGRDPEAVRLLQEQLTAMMTRTGLSSMASRVLTHLFTDDTANLTAADLTSRLRVSPASVSKAVGDLEQQGLIRREHDPHRRRDRYIVDDDVWIRAWLASARMNMLLAETTRHGAHTLGAHTPAGARLRDTSEFLDRLNRDMTRAAERWRQSLQPDA